MPHPRPLAVIALTATLAAALPACGRSAPQRAARAPGTGVKGTEKSAARDLGFPILATKNTTRIAGADAIAVAAGAARAVYSAGSRVTQPRAVAVVDGRDWRAALAASVLMSPPLRAPMLLATGPGELPPASATALAAMAPTGAPQAGDAQVIRVGDVPRPAGLRTTDLRGADTFALARAIDAFHAAARGGTSERLLIVSADAPEFAMPAAAWAAKAGDPILFVRRDVVPLETMAAIRAHQKPKIYVLGPSSVISPVVTRSLRRVGTVTRIGGSDPITNAVAFARFSDGVFGWGLIDPGHGVVFASAKRPLDAPAAAPLSASGKYGPLLLIDDARLLPRPVEDLLLDIQPGYTRDPVRGVYNHGWIVGDSGAISAPVQSQIDALLEIVPVTERRSTP